MEKLETLENKAEIEWKRNSQKISFLKTRVDSDVLDKAFHNLHERLFGEYDCSKCRNCCKKSSGVFTPDEVKAASMDLGISEIKFKEKYLKSPDAWEYEAKGTPCALFDGKECILSPVSRPRGCREYPYTDKSEMQDRLYSVLGQTSVCPVVLEIMRRINGEVKMVEMEEGICEDSMDL